MINELQLNQRINAAKNLQKNASGKAQAAGNQLPEGQIAYILKGYPRLSEVFITNEIHLLERQGMKLQLFVIKKENEPKTHPVVAKIKAPMHILPKMTSLTNTPFGRWCRENMPAYIAAHRKVVVRRPLRYLKTLTKAVWMCFRYRSETTGKPKKVFFKEFLQAGFVANGLLEAGNVTHLHAHFCHGSTTVAMLASKLTDIPYSFTAHAKDIYLPALNPGDLLQKKIDGAKFVVTCTGANRIHLQKLNRFGTPIFAIRHGLDIGHFAPVRSTENGQKPLILAVGRFVKKKGFEHLVSACKTLKDRGVAFRCHIVGEADAEKPVIANMLKSFELEEDVLLKDAVTQAELRDLYQRADIFALPCQVVENGDRDGIPNVLAEAMAMEMPVVSTPISGIPELVTNGEDGLLVPQRDPVALADALENLLRDGKLRQEIGNAGRRKILRMFDSDVTTEMLKEVFLASMSS